MKPVLVAALAAVTLLAAGCSSGSSPAEEEASPSTPTATAAVEPDPPAGAPSATAATRSNPGDDPETDAFLLDFIDANIPNASEYATGDQVFAAATAACDAMDAGVTMREYYAVMAGMDAPDEEKSVVAAIVGMAISTYCPEHLEEG